MTITVGAISEAQSELRKIAEHSLNLGPDTYMSCRAKTVMAALEPSALPQAVEEGKNGVVLSEAIAWRRSYANGITERLNNPNWRPSRANIEGARNALLELCDVIEAAPAPPSPPLHDTTVTEAMVEAAAKTICCPRGCQFSSLGTECISYQVTDVARAALSAAAQQKGGDSDEK